MNYYRIYLTHLSIDQNLLIQSVKQQGGDAIQTSDGLFIALNQAPVFENEVEISIKPVDVANEELTLDMQNLVAKYP
jgi:hypothetical protein